ncbi:hypothetical protein B484DRAFT_406937, partial [Ochromonadaceae sp. CCMP2298]
MTVLFRTHDALKLIECAWYWDTSTTSLQRMLSAINEEVRIYDPELRAAKAEGTGAYAKLQKAAVDILLDRIIAGRVDTNRQPALVRTRLRELCIKEGKPPDIETLIQRLIANTKFIVSAIQEATECGLAARRIPQIDHAGDRVRLDNDKRRRVDTDRLKNTDPPAEGTPCNACGKINHKRRDCKLKNHPDSNKTREPWATSDCGRRYAKAGKSELKWGENEDEGQITMGPSMLTKPTTNNKGDKPKWQQKKDKAHPYPGMQVETLLDTGAVQGDYCSRAVGYYVRQHCPENWQAADEEETIALAASGTSTMAFTGIVS